MSHEGVFSRNQVTWRCVLWVGDHSVWPAAISISAVVKQVIGCFDGWLYRLVCMFLRGNFAAYLRRLPQASLFCLACLLLCKQHLFTVSSIQYVHTEIYYFAKTQQLLFLKKLSEFSTEKSPKNQDFSFLSSSLFVVLLLILTNFRDKMFRDWREIKKWTFQNNSAFLELKKFLLLNLKITSKYLFCSLI